MRWQMAHMHDEVGMNTFVQSTMARVIREAGGPRASEDAVWRAFEELSFARPLVPLVHQLSAPERRALLSQAHARAAALDALTMLDATLEKLSKSGVGRLAHWREIEHAAEKLSRVLVGASSVEAFNDAVQHAQSLIHVEEAPRSDLQ